MQRKIASLMLPAAAILAACAMPHAAHAAAGANAANAANATSAAKAAARNEAVTRRHFAALVAGEPKLAELTMFFTMMPKGGDLHHHYSGAIYAEQYLEWVDQQHYCVNRSSYRIETDKATIAAEQAKPAAERACVTGQQVMGDNTLLAQVLQHWSDKDFYNHSGNQSPPDRQFFDTFGYFGPVASSNAHDGLQRLKQRAIQENLSYIETIFELAPFTHNDDFDREALAHGVTDAALEAYSAQLEHEQGYQQWIASYLDNLNKGSAGIDDAQFTMRYQPFVLRFLSPSQVFASMVSSFKLAALSPLVVGVNIVGQESVNVSMRDYAMHMQMFKFLKAKYPNVKLSLHAGELALGMVPPEGLTFHIKDAVDVAGASRIGHGMDIAHESNPLAIMKTMHDKGIAVEVNLSSNEFILGIKGAAHPVTLYRKYGVPFVLATDDAGVSRNNLSGEYVLYAARYRPDYAEVKKLSYDSLRYAFLAPADKQRLLKALDARFASFEAAIAAAEPRRP